MTDLKAIEAAVDALLRASYDAWHERFKGNDWRTADDQFGKAKNALLTLVEGVCRERDAAENSLIEAETRPHEAIGWLIEWPASDNFPARWWHPVTGWMLDANNAVRFSRKEDGEAYRCDMVIGADLRVTEHIWIASLAATDEVQK